MEKLLSEKTGKKQGEVVSDEKSDLDVIISNVEKMESSKEGQAKLLQAALAQILSENVTTWNATFRSQMRTELDMMSVHLSRADARKAMSEGDGDKAKICACPNCGNDAPRVTFVGFTKNSAKKIKCYRCKNQSPAKQTEDEAIAVWNEAAENGVVFSEESVLG